MTQTFTAQAGLGIEACCNCGIYFAMPEEFQRQRRNDHRDFYCPNGHAQRYTGPTEADRLRKELDHVKGRNERLVEQRDNAQRSNAALRGVITRQSRKRDTEAGTAA